MSSPTATVVAFFETLTPATLPALASIYSDDARFVDPFNDVTGLPAIRTVFDHMFAALDEPRFEVIEAVTEGNQCFLVWNFRFRRRGRNAVGSIHGASHLRFATDGRVTLHHDYWDAAQQVYEGVPLLGAVMRWLRRRLSAGERRQA
ncbi:MAG: nuclear transport factor 2 family protein [Burkholderiaceae bacterium]